MALPKKPSVADTLSTPTCTPSFKASLIALLASPCVMVPKTSPASVVVLVVVLVVVVVLLPVPILPLVLVVVDDDWVVVVPVPAGVVVAVLVVTVFCSPGVCWVDGMVVWVFMVPPVCEFVVVVVVTDLTVVVEVCWGWVVVGAFLAIVDFALAAALTTWPLFTGLVLLLVLTVLEVFAELATVLGVVVTVFVVLDVGLVVVVWAITVNDKAPANKNRVDFLRVIMLFNFFANSQLRCQTNFKFKKGL
jgi:hypothetical protein